MIGKNIILNKFSSTFWIEKEKMQSYFKQKGYNDFESVYGELEEMRVRVFDFLLMKTEPNLQLSEHEIVELSVTFLKENYPWINKKGIKSVNNHILWMCWHEGLLK